jgi:hypothetical protein
MKCLLVPLAAPLFAVQVLAICDGSNFGIGNLKRTSNGLARCECLDTLWHLIQG